MMAFLVSCEHVSAEVSKENLFCTSSFISAKVSPNGNVIACVGADAAGVSNVFITSQGDAERTQITFFKSPEIIQFFWSANSDKVLLLKEEDGTGRLHLHGVAIESKEHVVYTEKSSKVIQVSSQKNAVVIGLNNRNPYFYDLYLLDLDSGDFRLLLENNCYAKFLFSDSLSLILKMKINGDGSWTVFTEDDAIFMHLSSEEAFQTEFISYDEGARAVYLVDNRFSDTNQLVVKPLSDLGRESVLGAQESSDIDEVLWVDGKPRAYASYETQKKWHVIDASAGKDISFLEDRVGGNFEVINQSRDGNVWIVSNSIPDEGTYFWRYERKPQNLSVLHSPAYSKGCF
jgi:hypothetical protein